MKHLVSRLLLLASFTAKAEMIDQTQIKPGYHGTLTADLPTGFNRTQSSIPGTISYAYRGNPNCVIGFGRILTDVYSMSISLYQQWQNSIQEIAQMYQLRRFHVRNLALIGPARLFTLDKRT